MKIIKEKPKSWMDLQLKVGKILSECGFDVEIEKKIKTARGTVEIDVYALENINARKYSLLCECKYWNTSIPQTIIHGFRTVIADIGCNIGYVITTNKFQSGAREVAEKTNIELITWDEFQNIFFESWYSNYFYKELINSVISGKDYHWVDWFDDLNKFDKSIYTDLKNRFLELIEIGNYFPAPFIRDMDKNKFPIPKLPLENSLFDMTEYYGDLPLDILKEDHYDEFLKKLVPYSNKLYTDFEQLENKYKQK